MTDYYSRADELSAADSIYTICTEKFFLYPPARRLRGRGALSDSMGRLSTRILAAETSGGVSL